MEIFVDNEPYCPRDPAPITVDQLIAQIKPKLSDIDRMIVTIACDQKEISEHEIDAVLGREIAGYQRLDFTTAAVSDLATDAMQTAMTILSATRVKQTEAIELEPLQVTISETTIVVYGNSSSSGKTGTNALSANAP